MALFTAIATAVTAITGSAFFGAVASFAARTLLTIGVSKLIANRSNKTAAGTEDAGARVQLPPATNNKIPVVYGKAYIAPVITDAKISTDQNFMWYVCSLAEVTTGSGYTFGDIYYDGKKVVFDGTDTSKVNSLETNSDPIQIDDKVAGKIRIYKFPNGSSSGISTGGSNAITLLSDSTTGGGIPANQRWNGPIYTTGGESADMTNLCFLVVRVEFNKAAGTTSLGSINVELTNSLTKPGEVLLDYMTDDVYGCAIPLANIDIASLTALDVYADQTINFTDTNGNPATQARYRINGPVNTGQNCLNNLQELVDACDSWLQYSELTAQWKVVINREWDWVISGPPPAITTLYQVNNNNLIGGINVNPIDLNSAYNRLEVQYPNKNIRDQTDFRVIELIDYVPEVISLNEPENSLTVQYPQVNNYIQSLYLGIRRLLQSREDLVVDFLVDYSGIQIEAGDVIAIDAEQYGWEQFNSGYGKLFRVSQVQEAKLENGSLGARITAFEYNDLVYADNALVDFVPEANTGLTDPNIISKPTKPIVTLVPTTANNSTATFTVASNVSQTGTVLYMDFNYGNSSNTQQHVRYTTVNTADGQPWVANTTVTINVADLPAGNLYWSSTARNDTAGRTSDASDPFSWGGPSINPPSGNGGTGPGGVTGNTIQSNTITYNNMGNSVIVSTGIGGYDYEIPNNFANTVTLPVNITGFAANVKVGNFDTPKYLNTSYTGSGGLFPYYDGNATVSMGYIANSSARWQPALASQLVVWNGDLNWWMADYDTLSTTVETTEQLNISYYAQIVSDTDNTIVQFAPAVTFNSTGNNIYVDTAAHLDTLVLYAGVPTTIDIEVPIIGSNAIDGGGILCRRLSGSGNVQWSAGILNLTKQKR